MKTTGARARRAAGFSLIELMSAMAVGTLVLLVAASLLGRVGTEYGRVSGGVGAEREARAALGQLTADAATALHLRDAVFESIDKPWPLDKIGFLSLQSPACGAGSAPLSARDSSE